MTDNKVSNIISGTVNSTYNDVLSPKDGDNTKDTIGLHLKNIYKTGELEEISTTEKYSVV